jgi:hypothetical protein
VLAEIFSVGIYASAVMSNHVHVVVRIDPTAAAAWTDEEVAMRWVRLFPATTDGEPNEAGCRRRNRPCSATQTACAPAGNGWVASAGS